MSHPCNSLYQKIDTEKLECLNESEEGSGKTVFKAWDDRLDKTKVIISAVSILGNVHFTLFFCSLWRAMLMRSFSFMCRKFMPCKHLDWL